MRKIKFEKDIGGEALLELITSHLIHGFFYTVVSRKTFGKIAENDVSINIMDMRDQGLGYMWYSYNNFIYIITDDDLKNNELVYLNEEDLHILIRNKKLKILKEKING